MRRYKRSSDKPPLNTNRTGKMQNAIHHLPLRKNSHNPKPNDGHRLRLPPTRPPRFLARTTGNPNPRNRRFSSLVRLLRRRLSQSSQILIIINPQATKNHHTLTFPPPTPRRRIRRRSLQFRLLPRRHHQIADADRGTPFLLLLLLLLIIGHTNGKEHFLEKWGRALEATGFEGIVSGLWDYGCEIGAEFGAYFCDL